MRCRLISVTSAHLCRCLGLAARCAPSCAHGSPRYACRTVRRFIVRGTFLPVGFHLKGRRLRQVRLKRADERGDRPAPAGLGPFCRGGWLGRRERQVQEVGQEGLVLCPDPTLSSRNHQSSFLLTTISNPFFSQSSATLSSHHHQYSGIEFSPHPFFASSSPPSFRFAALTPISSPLLRVSEHVSPTIDALN